MSSKIRGTQMSAYEMAMDIERLTGRDTFSIVTEAVQERRWEDIAETERQELVLDVWKAMIEKRNGKGGRKR